MAAFDLEERKRPLDGAIQGASKRPHLDHASSSYKSNGNSPYRTTPAAAAAEAEDDSIPAYKGLEDYRKEAIFRLMREAQRDRARSENKVAELQGLMREAEERCSDMNHFWNLLIEDVQLLVRPDALGSRHTALLDAVPLTTRRPAASVFSKSLQERRESIKSVLSYIASLDAGSSPAVDEVQARCHRLAEEASSLRAQSAKMMTEREALLEDLETANQRLRRAEKKLDRLHSGTVKRVERPNAEKEEAAEQAKADAADAERQAAMQRKEQAESSLAEMQHTNGNAHDALNEELEEARQMANTRSHEMEELRAELARLRQSNDELAESAQRVSGEQIAASPIYRELHNHFEHAKEEHARIVRTNEQLQVENAELRELRVQFQQSAKSEADAQVDELRTAVKTHEADGARLRGQRDEATADLAERKQMELVRRTEIDNLKELVQTKDLRIATLKSEIRRVQRALAASSGDRVLSEKLASLTDADEVEIISELQARLKAAEEASANVQRQLDARASSTSEADLAKKVADLQRDLDAVSNALGGATSLSPDEARSKLTTQHEDLERLKAELATASTSTAALCDELDKLGAAYNESQKVASVRIAEIGRMEEKVGRLTTEKGKADNKYFSAMRAKDAVENERRVLARNLERQTRVIEQYGEAEKAFQAQLQQDAVEATRLRALTNELSAKIAEQQRDLQTALERERQATLARDRFEATSRQHIDEFGAENRARIEAQERCDKLQRDLDKCRKQLASADSGKKKGGASSGDDAIVDHLNALLKCSTCHERYRNRIILRCLHTFCNECVDARIQTRQRKCPHCGVGFSTSEVQTLYLQ